MNNRSVHKLLGIFGIALLTISCISESRSYDSTYQATPSPTPQIAEHIQSPSPTASPMSTKVSAIRSIDFNKVTYPNFPSYIGSGTKRITLKAGNGRPSYISYGDITGD